MAFDALARVAPTAPWQTSDTLLEVKRKPSSEADTAKNRSLGTAQELRASFWVGRPVVRNFTAEAQRHTRLVPLQTWEGFVESVAWEEGTFWARLHDLEPDANGDAEMANLLIADVDDDDHELIREGGVFRWVIGYREEIFGKRERISKLIFRRLPGWSQRSLEAAQQEGKALADAIRWT